MEAFCDLLDREVRRKERDDPKPRAAELFEESLAIGEARGDVDRRARQLTNLGLAIRELGDAARAHELLRNGLADAQEIGLEEGTLARLRDALGAELLASELVAGAAMSHQDAIDLALGRTGLATPTAE